MTELNQLKLMRLKLGLTFVFPCKEYNSITIIFNTLY